MGGADANLVAFHGSTRLNKTKAGVSYDHEAEPSYEVTIKSVDSHGAAATMAVTIEVTDEDAPSEAPAAPSVDITAATSIEPGYRLGGAGQRQQADNSKATTCATGPAAPGTGPKVRQDVATTAWTLENLTAGTTYEVQVRATYEEVAGHSTQSGSGSTNAAPAFTSNTATRSVAENSVADANVGAVIHAATDADNDPLTYMMEGAAADSFACDATTRQIKTKAGVRSRQRGRSVLRDDDQGSRTSTAAPPRWR